MKKLLLSLACLLVLTTGGIGVAASQQPDRTHIERSIQVQGTVADLEPHVVDFTTFVSWSPWADLDPDQVNTFSDPPSGLGAWYAWEGNADVGKGRMDLTLVEPGRVTHHLTFIEPIPAEADASILWVEAGDGLQVTWTYDAENDFMAKAMSLFLDMDSLLGPDYEKGLDALKRNVERNAEIRRGKARRAAERAAAEAAGAANPAGAPD